MTSAVTLCVLLICLGCRDRDQESSASDLRPPELYRRQSRTTNPGKDSLRIAAMPVSPRAIFEQLDRVALASYPAPGMNREQHEDVSVSSVAEMLEVLGDRGNDLRSESVVSRKFVGLCYHWSALATSVLRSRGYACRIRCGFAPYLWGDQLGIDHTVIELWQPDVQRWQLIDPELISIQPEASINILHISEPIDPYDIARDRFHFAATAWINYRARRVPDGFYGLGNHEPSLGFVRTSLIRDWLNILCDEHNVSFDAELKIANGLSEEDFLDSVAILMLAPDSNFESLKELSAAITRD